MSVKNNLGNIKGKIGNNAILVAVSKTYSTDIIMQAYAAGQKVFGENKAQELISKQPLLPDDIRWHFIGHMQRNKVKYIAPFVDMIESVDSLKLLKEINKQAAKNNRTIKCLLQFHIAKEETKYGLSLEEAEEILNSEEFDSLKNITISGVMGMATFTDDEEKVRTEFRSLQKIFKQLKESFFKNDDQFKEISMGMSGDYLIAIEEGSTIVRIGSAIFGERNYH